MLAMIEQKETQAKRLEELRRKKKAEERKRKKEIARLKKEREEKIIDGLKPEVEKYKKIAASKYGQSMKSAAWKSLVSKYPSGWADGVEEGDCDDLLFRIHSGGKIKKRFANSIGQEFAYIKPGTFMMGSPSNESGRHGGEKQHKVTLSRKFYMQTTEVTQGQWKAVMGNNPSIFKKGDNYPVECVSWNDAQKFIRKLNKQEGIDKYRMPTEAEWEYACRAGTTTPFSFGRCLSTDQANYNGKYPLDGCSKGKYRKKTVSVASFSPNAWGLYDMHGNVWEWCQDSCNWESKVVTDTYRDGIVDPFCTKGSRWVIRGGCWSFSARCCRSAIRYGSSLGSCNDYLGFRLSRTF
ncbi:MAG: formylglycine-generating enzyme family protein [Deltaproteobacteria bacterium]|nr:formylglycine-generating enzyme family protein [Deltaproteobacteria bacterium]